MADQYIGNFRFLILAGQIVPPSPRIESFTRPGIDGVGLLDLGRQPDGFTMRSKVDAADLAAAEELFELYLDLKGQNPVALIKDGLESTSARRPYLVAVLDVKQVVCRAIVGVVGGLNPPSYGWLEADWHLVAVEI